MPGTSAKTNALSDTAQETLAWTGTSFEPRLRMLGHDPDHFEHIALHVADLVLKHADTNELDLMETLTIGQRNLFAAALVHTWQASALASELATRQIISEQPDP